MCPIPGPDFHGVTFVALDKTSNAVYIRSMRKGIHRGNLISPWPDISHFTEPDAAYFAGIIDGEGWISVTTLSHNRHANWEVNFGTVSSELIAWVVEYLPFARLTGRKLVLNTKGDSYRKHGYEVHLRGARVVVRVLLLILPYLTIKRVKAIEAITILDSRYHLLEEIPPFPDHLSRDRSFLPISHTSQFV